MPTVIASGTVPALTVATYTFPRRANLRLQPEPGEQAIVKITRGPLTVFSTVLTTEQNYGPFLGGDVLEITAQRGACDYFIINPGLLLAELDGAFDSETGALEAYINPINGNEEVFEAGGTPVELESSIEGGQSLVIPGEVDGFPGIRISAHEFDASYFGFVSSNMAHPSNLSLLAPTAPDSSAAMRNVEDLMQTWKAKTARPTVVHFQPGVYAMDRIRGREVHANQFYPRNNLILRGHSSHSTALCATVSSEAQFFGLLGDVNWVGSPTLQGFTLIGAGAANPYQVGVLINPEYIPDQESPGVGFGGVTLVHWKDIDIQNFARQPLWMRGGAEDFRIPIQYGIWDSIRCFALSPNYETALFTGQIGPPWQMNNFECYGVGGNPASKICRVGFDRRTGMVIASVDAAANTLTFAEPHFFRRGDRFALASGTGWGGLSVGVDYFASPVNDFTIRVCTTLFQAYQASPVVVDLTAATGTATVSATPVPNVQIGTVQLVLNTATFQSGAVGLDVETSHVSVSNLHIEETGSAVRVDASAFVYVNGGSVGNGARYGGILFDDSSGGTISVENVKIDGLTGKLFSGASFGAVYSPTPRNLGGQYYPTIGSGISGQVASFHELPQAAEVDLGKRDGGEYLFRTGTTVVTHVRWQAFPGFKAFFRVFNFSGDFVDIANSGNIRMSGADFNGNVLRLPLDATFTLTCTALNQGVTLSDIRMPTHSASWAMGTGTLVAGARATTTIACPGARVGDLDPIVSLSGLLPAGVLLSAVITATDTATLTVTNTGTATSGALPGTVTAYVRQVR